MATMTGFSKGENSSACTINIIIIIITRDITAGMAARETLLRRRCRRGACHPVSVYYVQNDFRDARWTVRLTAGNVAIIIKRVDGRVANFSNGRNGCVGRGERDVVKKKKKEILLSRRIAPVDTCTMYARAIFTIENTDFIFLYFCTEYDLL